MQHPPRAVLPHLSRARQLSLQSLKKKGRNKNSFFPFPDLFLRCPVLTGRKKKTSELYQDLKKKKRKKKINFREVAFLIIW